MQHRLSTFSLVGSVILRVSGQEYTLHAEMSPAEALELSQQLHAAACRAYEDGVTSPPDYLRRAPESLAPEHGN